MAYPGEALMAGHLIDESAKGVFIVAATPFTQQGGLDLRRLERLDRRIAASTA
jgi:dihydrodipicolinate synthase/N-acetylneuraminate lyase